MGNVAALLFVTLGGAGCGLLFFGGLWWTIQFGIRSSQAALWFVGSLLLRGAVVVLGFVWIGQHDWTRMLGVLLGFVGMRCIVQHVIGTPRCT